MLDTKIQKKCVVELNTLLLTKYIPHILFHGPPGTGKTTLAKLFAKQVVGSLNNLNFLEVNASDNRGIDAMREIVIGFAKHAAFGGRKIVLLDEADYLTPDAQATLRQPMLKFKQNCLFLLTCNSIHKMHSAIVSRCKTFELLPLPPEQMRYVLTRLCNTANLILSETRKNELIRLAQGDIRYLENNLMSAVTDLTPHLSLKLLKSLSIVEAYELVKSNLQKVPATLTLKMLLEEVIHNPDLSAADKSTKLLALAEADIAIAEGATELIQLVTLIEKLNKDLR